MASVGTRVPDSGSVLPYPACSPVILQSCIEAPPPGTGHHARETCAIIGDRKKVWTLFPRIPGAPYFRGVPWHLPAGKKTSPCAIRHGGAQEEEVF